MPRNLPLAAALVLAACTPDGPTAGGICGADILQDLVGRDASALMDFNLPDSTRIIRPQTRVTTDLRPERLNIVIGRDGKIEMVSCG